MTEFVSLGVIGCGLMMASCASSKTTSVRVAIQPLGPVPAAQLHAVQSGIESVHHLKVTILPAKALPESAFYRERNRYRADDLLVFLDEETETRFAKVIGVTVCDIGIDRAGERASGIMGIAEHEDRACVVSTHRLGHGGADASLRMERLARVAAHEIGHTRGLLHCGTPHCLMNDARGAVATVDASTGRLCWRCRLRLRRGIMDGGGARFPL